MTDKVNTKKMVLIYYSSVQTEQRQLVFATKNLTLNTCKSDKVMPNDEGRDDGVTEASRFSRLLQGVLWSWRFSVNSTVVIWKHALKGIRPRSKLFAQGRNASWRNILMNISENGHCNEGKPSFDACCEKKSIGSNGAGSRLLMHRKYVLPGVIDDQVHFRDLDLHKGDIYSESSCCYGGVTSFMGNLLHHHQRRQLNCLNRNIPALLRFRWQIFVLHGDNQFQSG